MMRLYHLLALCLISVDISARPSSQPREPAGYVSIPFRKSLHARPRMLNSRQDESFTTSVHNDVYSYHVDVNVGSPSQPLELLLDTGSSDLFVFAASCSGCSSKSFDTSKSTTFKRLTDLGNFDIAYGDGSSVSGYYVLDRFGVENGVVPQTFGVATKAKGSGFDNGIFGIGLDQGETVVDNNHDYYPGYISTLKNEGLIKTRVYSMYLNSQTASDTAEGLIIFGGYDTAKWTGNLISFPMVERAPDGQFRLDVLEPSISYSLGSGSVSIAAVSTKYTVLMDTGTPLCYIPTAQFEVISKAVGARILDDAPVYSVDCSLAQKPDGISFDFTGPNGTVAVTVPWTEMTIKDSTLPAGRCVFGLAPASNSAVYGVYTLGDTFIRSAYLLFDYDDLTISIAQVNYDHQKRSQIVAL